MNTVENSVAFGAPGIEPRWTSSAKEGVGTSYHTGCPVWFTLNHKNENSQLRGTGFIGNKLVNLLRARGHEVVTAISFAGINSITGEGLTEAVAARKNRIAILIYVAAIRVAFAYTPLALIVTALPGTDVFLPGRRAGKFDP